MKGIKSVHQSTVREHSLAFELRCLDRKRNYAWRIVWVARLSSGMLFIGVI